jgi:hypothetical protein
MSHADQLIEIATEFAMDAKDDVADLRRKLSAMGVLIHIHAVTAAKRLLEGSQVLGQV